MIKNTSKKTLRSFALPSVLRGCQKYNSDANGFDMITHSSTSSAKSRLNALNRKALRNYLFIAIGNQKNIEYFLQIRLYFLDEYCEQHYE